MLWVVAALLLISSLALFAFLAKDSLRFQLLPLTITFSNIIDLVLLIIAVFSLFIAMASLRETMEGGRQQQISLDASRKQLEAVVEKASQQHAVLETSMAISKTQLGILQEQSRREEERLSRVPSIEIGLNDVDAKRFKETQTFVIDLHAQDWVRLDFTVTNKGKAALVKPVILIQTQPASVAIHRPDHRAVHRTNPNTFQFSGISALDILPIEISGSPYSFIVDITVPAAINEFDFVVRIYGENFKGQEFKKQIQVKRDQN